MNVRVSLDLVVRIAQKLEGDGDILLRRFVLGGGDRAVNIGGIRHAVHSDGHRGDKAAARAVGIRLGASHCGNELLYTDLIGRALGGQQLQTGVDIALDLILGVGHGHGNSLPSHGADLQLGGSYCLLGILDLAALAESVAHVIETVLAAHEAIVGHQRVSRLLRRHLIRLAVGGVAEHAGGSVIEV